MSYCTQEDIQRKRIPEQTLIDLTDDQGLATVDTTVVDEAIAEAGELIDGYLRDRYSLPLSAVSGVVNSLALDIATHILYGRRAEFKMPENVGKAYDNALRMLREIRVGNISLGLPSPSGQSATSGASFTGGGRRFTRDSQRSR